MRLLTIAASLCLAGAAAAQPAPFDALAASSRIVNDLAHQDIDAAAEDAARLMETMPADRLRGTFHFVKDLGASEYTDLVYARDYGRSGKDLIYKINFAKTFLFVRLLYQVNNGSWHLIHLTLKTEDELPFPRDWKQIYPR